MQMCLLQKERKEAICFKCHLLLLPCWKDSSHALETPQGVPWALSPLGFQTPPPPQGLCEKDTQTPRRDSPGLLSTRAYYAGVTYQRDSHLQTRKLRHSRL